MAAIRRFEELATGETRGLRYNGCVDRGVSLHELAFHVAVAIDGIAIAIIAFGGVGAVVGIGRIVFSSTSTDWDRRAVWLSFVRWLVAGLTFQLAADVVVISFAPSWNTLGQLAATAVIRTFISYFFDREANEMRALRRVEGKVAD